MPALRRSFTPSASDTNLTLMQMKDIEPDNTVAEQTPSAARWTKHRALAQWAVYILLGLAILLGTQVRVKQFLRSDPLRAGSDLKGTFQVWTDLTGELGRAPSNRFGEYGLATGIGLISDTLDYDMAHSLQFLTLLCSLGMIGVGGLFVWAIHGEVLPAVVAAAILALCVPFIDQTLAATSASPFLFCCGGGTALMLLYWRYGKLPLLVLGSMMLALGCAIRGTGLLHLVPLGLALTAIYFLSVSDRAKFKPRVLTVWAALVLVAMTFLTGKALVVRQITARYEARDGQPPALVPYTPYVVFDGIMHGPYFSDSKGWQRREQVRKTPALRDQDPLFRGDSTLKIIWDHRSKYIGNYVSGVGMTLKKLASDRALNFVTVVPSLLGLAVLAYKRQWGLLLIIGGWLSVYVFVVPAVCVLDRTVWPVCLGLLALSAFGLSSAYKWIMSRPLSGRLPVTLALVGVMATGLCVAGRKTIAYGQRTHVDRNRVVRDNIPDVPDRPTRVLASRAELCLYGRPVVYLQASPSPSEEDQARMLAEVEPDVVYLADRRHAGAFREAFDALERILQRQRQGQPQWVQLWTDGQSEIWGRSRMEQLRISRKQPDASPR